MAKSSGVDSVGLVVTAIGSLLVYAGIKGYSMLALIQNVVSGKPALNGVVPTTPLTAPKTTAGDSGNLNPNVNPQK